MTITTHKRSRFSQLHKDGYTLTRGKNMRTDISIELKCSRCGELLESDSTHPKQRIECGSAYKATAVMMIKPCGKCVESAEQPIRKIREALGLTQS